MRFQAAALMPSERPRRSSVWRRALTLLTCGVFVLGPTAEAQTPAKQTKPPQQVKEDVKGALKAADRGDQAAALGRMEEALADYDAAVRMAPGDIGIRRRAAGAKDGGPGGSQGRWRTDRRCRRSVLPGATNRPRQRHPVRARARTAANAARIHSEGRPRRLRAQR